MADILRVLLVEDEDSIRSALLRGLSLAGHDVRACASLAEARTAAAGWRAQALVSDLRLNDGSGIELARELAVPSVFMSGYAVFDDAVAALRAGAVEFLTKPISLRDIRRALERIALAGTAGPVVVEAEADAAVVLVHRAVSEGVVRDEVQSRRAQWSTPAQAREAFAALAPALPRLVHRRIAAELMQDAGMAGRIIVNAGEGRWSCRCDGENPSGQDARALCALLAREWRVDGSATVVAVGDEAVGTAAMTRGATSQHEWLWPMDLAAEDRLDLSQVVAIGGWFAAWLRQHPQVGVCGANADIRRHLDHLGVGVCWLDQARPRPGISSAERAALLGS